ncbi:protein DCL homolog, chloroplastic-like [Humulus lupulus]|uniref:protein DCL homolog, chloroplastic-like n=1 Tax=Humulus lupulus TaxID=3486 RepID=UPI002B4079D1|nr:protein DCL homolog, chloroplastic-like [Humulus lupulus]
MAATGTSTPSSAPNSGFRRNWVIHSSSSYKPPLVCVLKTASSDDGRVTRSHDSYAPSLLRKPVVIPLPKYYKEEEQPKHQELEEEEKDGSESDQWVDWEDRILEETVPLVGFVRTIIHSGEYKIGDKLSDEHENVILEKLLPFHPDYETKIGCGVQSIKLGFHPEFKRTKCLFVVRKDGESVDFSYWKCIKGLIRKKYPLFADAFILRHFRPRRSKK